MLNRSDAGQFLNSLEMGVEMMSRQRKTSCDYWEV